MSEKKLVQEGLFFVYVKADKDKKVSYSGKEYSESKMLPKITKDNINSILSGNTTIKFLGITADQQLYKPHKDANILVSALNHPSSMVKLVFRRNGVVWFDDTDYCKRVWQNKFQVLYAPNIQTIHYCGQSFAQQKIIKKQWRFLKSALKYFFKHGFINTKR